MNMLIRVPPITNWCVDITTYSPPVRQNGKQPPS